MSVLMSVPVEDGVEVLVEVDRSEIPGELVLASPPNGEAAARTGQSLADALKQLQPVLRTVKEQLAAASPDEFTVEFGLKVGGQTGLIIAKGTAEVNFKVTMAWKRPDVVT